MMTQCDSHPFQHKLTLTLSHTPQANVVNPLGIGDMFEFKAMRSTQATSYDISYQIPVGGSVDFPLAFHARKVGRGARLGWPCARAPGHQPVNYTLLWGLLLTWSALSPTAEPRRADKLARANYPLRQCGLSNVLGHWAAQHLLQPGLEECRTISTGGVYIVLRPAARVDADLVSQNTLVATSH